MRKRDRSADGGVFDEGPASTGRITPADVQQKEFSVARFGGGYRMREVDEFLDRITDALQALTSENEGLLGRGSASATPRAPSAPPTAGGADRAAVDAFLQREKGFLQSLGGLVQGHAEDLKEMVRATRRQPATPAAVVAPAEPAPMPVVVEPVNERADVPEERSEPTPDAVEASEDADTSGVAEASSEDATEQATPRMEPQPPIRLEDPEPARSRRSDEKEDGSLRELFWGEE